MNGNTILEPSAGKGVIADRIFETCSVDNLSIDCVELNKENCEVLKGKGYNTFHQDFLLFRPDRQYDRIIACPPFKKNVDLLHIKHMFALLKPTGVLVSLSSPFWITNNEEHQIEFRQWLSQRNHQMQMLPDNSFVENNKTVPTIILKITK